jgi:hypothetical protein
VTNRSFHAGERAVQEHYGSRALLRDHEQDIFDGLAITGKVALSFTPTDRFILDRLYCL